ncbi:MAG TPA: YkgJ family cysteine cluster protein [Bacilli bacterium]|nr:YkgJ family cysteine cluster protein [Bacilli bacterium]
MQEEKKKEFICTKCGACCRNIKYSEEAKFLDRGDGICKYLDENTNLCKIYDFRPNICRTDKMYKKYKSQMTWNEYVDACTNACEKLREVEKAKEYRKKYPGKRRYNDIFDRDEKDIEEGPAEEELNKKVEVSEPTEEYLFDDDEDFFADK